MSIKKSLCKSIMQYFRLSPCPLQNLLQNICEGDSSIPPFPNLTLLTKKLSSNTFFHDHSQITGLLRERENFFNSSLPLPLTSQTFRYQLSNDFKELTSAHSLQQDSNWEPSFMKIKSYKKKKRKIKQNKFLHY